MRFTVPQFIEREAKIVGPLTFRQFVYIGLAGGVSFVLYFSLGKTNFLLFLLLTIILVIGAGALAFLKIGGRGLPIILLNFLRYIFVPKLYIWQKRKAVIAVLKKERVKTEKKIEDELPLKIAADSQLKKLKTQIETKTK